MLNQISYLSVEEINYVKYVEDLILDLLKFESDLSKRLIIKSYIIYTPFDERYKFYKFLSYCLTQELNSDIILLLKTKIKKMEGSK